MELPGFEAFLDRHGEALGGVRVAVAFSCGLDSSVLLDALRRAGPRRGFALAAVHVNHGLRGDESEAEEASARDLCEKLAIPLRVARVHPEALRRVRGRARPTLQEAARRLRYDALRREAEGLGARWVALGHHADDQAETLMLSLLRGCGPDALAGMPERCDARGLLRPLLRAPRARLLEYARARDLSWCEDSSNARPHYARNRLRSHLESLARDFNPHLLRALADLAEAQRRDREWIGERVEDEVARRFSRVGETLLIRGDELPELPDALARRLMARALRAQGAARDISRRHIERMLTVVQRGRTGGSIELPGGLRFGPAGPDFSLVRVVKATNC